ncbi:MAG TPA: CRTAC1 family protein [Chloroflexi bacterium]|nr:CRTAC1 family protein [Chloroflexota bacterium]
MFTDKTALLRDNPAQSNYGIAVCDVDDDGAFEVLVAGFGYPNLALKWDGSRFVNVANRRLADSTRQAVGVAAGDLDGDGREEIYFLNTDTFGGEKQVGDRLFDFRGGRWVDLFSLPENEPAGNLISGRSVACVDRDGNGRYGFFVASYGGPMGFYELDDGGLLDDLAERIGVDFVTGGRGVVALPLVSEYAMDIFVTNENGANYLFRNRGDGTFEEIGQQVGLGDMHEHGRGVAALDANDDGSLDLVCGNWEGPHRLFVREGAGGSFRDVAPPEMSAPTRIRTVIAADFDNDGYEEIFFNNMEQPNRLFGRRDGRWVRLDVGDALEPLGPGTGAAIGDFDADGRLELFISHGETEAYPLSLYHSPQNDHAWLRIRPLTAHGAPARGALVRLFAGGRTQIRAIDAGSGYLCQMEPVAHFGLGAVREVEGVEVRWPDGAMVAIERPDINQSLTVPHP